MYIIIISTLCCHCVDRDNNETVRASAVEFLKSLVSRVPHTVKNRNVARKISAPVLAALSGSLQVKNSMMQVQLLGTIMCVECS